MYEVPSKQIKNVFEIARFYRSEAYPRYLGMLRRINNAIMGIPTNSSDPKLTPSEAVRAAMDLICEVEGWVDEIPLEDMGEQRFGNKAFRAWYARLQESARNLVEKLLPEGKKQASIELVSYLLDSFGNSTRIDYGSGHEAAFLMFLCCLYHLDVLKEDDDDVAVALRLFQRYLKCVRKLQKTYRMEPAGSRGVHALDDFQFVPFMWGSAQLIGNTKKLIPDSYTKPETVEAYQSHNLFFEAIQYINETKFGPFYEHSNQLYNISGVLTWNKVNEGMFKMYEGEVLKKFPIIQHFLFGSILSIEQRPEFVKPTANPVEARHAEQDVLALGTPI